MDAQLEILKRLLIETMREWLEKNRSTIGEEQYSKYAKHLRDAEERIRDRLSLMGYAIWALYLVQEHADIAYASKRKPEVWKLREGIEPRSTRQLLAVIHMCLR